MTDGAGGRAPARRRLLTAARTLLWEQGYAATSPRDIQKLSGVGQGSFYHHFESKKQLAATALRELAKEMIAESTSILTSEASATERLRVFIGKPRHGLAGCKLGRLASESGIFDADLNRPIRRYFAHLYGLLCDVIREAQKTGDISPRLTPETLAKLFISSIQGGYVLARIGDDDNIHQEIAGSLYELLDL